MITPYHEYHGKWLNNTESLLNFKHSSGYIKLKIKINKITKYGREINLKFMIDDGFYKDNWVIVDQVYLYFLYNEEDSDINYNITLPNNTLYSLNKK